MAANSLTVEQIYAIANTIQKEALGKDATIQVVDASTFQTVGQKLLTCAADTVLSAISQTLSKTLFAVRPYYRKFASLKVDPVTFGNWVRKLSVADSDFEAGEFSLPADGSSSDQWTVKRANILQLNFYGSNNFVLQHETIFRNQLNIAFSSAEELGRFWEMITINCSNQIEQVLENLARNLVSASIAGKIYGDSGNVINLLAEFLVDYPSSTLTAATCMNDPTFVKWAYARIKTVSDLMTERSIKFHQNVTGKVISRHTPKDKQRLFMYAPLLNKVETMTLADTYHPEKLDLGVIEKVNYWQNINDPMAINQKVQSLKADGTLHSAVEVAQDGVLGILFDEEFMFYSIIENYSLATPMNAKGAYSNVFSHIHCRYATDYTENAVVFIVEDEEEVVDLGNGGEIIS